METSLKRLSGIKSVPLLTKCAETQETHGELSLNTRLTLQDWGKLDWEVLIGRDLLPVLIHQRMSAQNYGGIGFS